MIAADQVTLGAHDGPGARITASIDGRGDPDLTLQLPLRTIAGRVAGAFQVQGWRWSRRADDLAAGYEIDVHYSVGLLGPRGGRHGTTVRLGHGQLQGLAISLRMIAHHVDNNETAMPIGVGIEGQERLFVTAAYGQGEVLGGRLWTKGVRGAGSRPLQPIHPEDLDHCAGMVRLVGELIA